MCHECGSPSTLVVHTIVWDDNSYEVVYAEWEENNKPIVITKTVEKMVEGYVDYNEARGQEEEVVAERRGDAIREAI